MGIAESMLPEFDQEMKGTRAMLERVPEDKLDWKPHEKSFPLGYLATHIAQLLSWTKAIFEQTEFDLASPELEKQRPEPPRTRLEIVQRFERSLAEARQALASARDADFMVPWTLRMGDRKIMTLPRAAMYRTMVMSHIIHHRAQLTVYYRLVGTPVPGLYGPTADEPM
ncbi:MAG: DinB family protein [Gemmatimonadota bacterium]